MLGTLNPPRPTVNCARRRIDGDWVGRTRNGGLLLVNSQVDCSVHGNAEGWPRARWHNRLGVNVAWGKGGAPVDLGSRCTTDDNHPFAFLRVVQLILQKEEYVENIVCFR